MNFKHIAGIFVLMFSVIALFSGANAQKVPDYKISSPYTYKNLSIFLIHGQDQAKTVNILTLQEAMENKEFAVYETSDVNELAVENLSKKYDVFIQSGDIVKGGKQDRVLAVSIIIKANSGRVLIQAFCVESGRWQKRGNESAGEFSSSNDRIVTKDLKMAANGSRSQSEVWKEVSEAQDKLSANTGVTVNSAASGTSLQLSLENSKVQEMIDKYVRNLDEITDEKTDVIGYAFAINGKINSADIYVSNSLFKRLWLKMLKAAATEAVADLDEKMKFGEVTAAEVRKFLEEADKGRAEQSTVAKNTTVTKRDDGKNVVFEARDEKAKAVIHRSYVKLQ